MRCAAIVVLCVCASPAFAQTTTFEDLARRAEAALDSNPAQAVSLYQQALAQRADWTEGWFYLGAALYQMDRYAEATAAFRKVTTLAPEHGTAWAFLGLCEAELDDPDQAIADVRKGEQLGIGDNRAFEMAVRVKAARVLIEQSAFDEAMEQLAPLAKRGDEAPPAVEAMGQCALGLSGKVSSLTADQRKLAASAGRAAWLSAAQKPTETRAAYQQLVSEFGNAPGVRYAHGLFLTESDLPSAIREFQAEVKDNASHWPARIVLSTFLIKQGEPMKAIEQLTAAIELAPVRYRWLCRAELGRAYLTAGKLPDALRELAAAVRWRPESAQIHFLLSEVHRRAGRKEEAQKERAEFQRLKESSDPLSIPTLRPFANAGRE